MKFLLNMTASAALLAFTSPAAHADVSIMYAEWMAALIEPGIEKFETETGETVNAIRLPGDGYGQRIALDLSAGTAADIIQIDSFMVPEFASSGYLMPLNDMAASWDPFSFYSPGILEVASYQGNLYGLPTDTDVRMLWYNRDLFEAAGVAMPWQPQTWAEVLDTAKTVQDAAGTENTFYLPAGTKQGEATTMQGFYMVLLGADVPDEGRNRLRSTTQDAWIGDSPALRRTLQFYQDVYVNDELNTASINYANDLPAATREAFANDQIAILSGGMWEFTCLWNCSGEGIPSQDDRLARLDWAPFPGSGEEGAPATTNVSGGWTLGMNAGVEDPDLAFQLMTTIFDAENFGNWTTTTSRMAVRSDVAESAAYQENPVLSQATALAETTTGRDTYPGYQTVSSLVQKATAQILDGELVEDVIQDYHDALVDEFGAEHVITFE